MGGKLYDYLKFLALVVLPAAATMYFTVAQIWAFPAPEQVVGTIVAVDTFLGIIINKASSDFKKNNTPAKIMGDIVMLQYPNGEIERPVIKPYDEMPIFPVDGVVGFKVRREQIPEPDHTQE
jgi:hypothetical protein